MSSFFPALCSAILPPCHTNSRLALDDNFSVWTSFFSCLSRVPIELLDFQQQQEEDVTGKGHSLNVARVHAILFLQKSGALQRHRGKDYYNDLFKAQLWIAKQQQQTNGVYYWLAALHLAHASSDMPFEPRKVLINALFEIMLVKATATTLSSSKQQRQQHSSNESSAAASTGYGCELLPQNAGLVCQFPPGLVFVLRRIMLQDCSKNLATQMGDLYMSSFVMNRALQVLSSSSIVVQGEGSTDGDDNVALQRRANFVECLESIVMRSNDYGGESAQRAQRTSFILSIGRG